MGDCTKNDEVCKFHSKFFLAERMKFVKLQEQLNITTMGQQLFSKLNVRFKIKAFE